MGVIERVVAGAVRSGAVPHVSAVVADRDGIRYECSAGPRTVGESGDVSIDTHFRLMSMTKPIVTVVALRAIEDGLLDPDAPVDEYRPEFAELPVLTGFDDDVPVYRKPRSRATVRQLMTHTSGHGYWFWSELASRWHRITRGPKVASGRIGAFGTPLVAEPGTAFTYGISSDWLGRVIEAATGKTLDIAVADTVTRPLGMSGTVFRLSESQVARSATMHIPAGDGWRSIGEVLNQEPDWWSAGHGLYSTPADYARFSRMLLAGGELDGIRVLRPESVAGMFANQIGTLTVPAVLTTYDPSFTADFPIGPGHKWSHGLLINTEEVPGQRRAFSGGWAGSANTYFWIDRTTGICAGLYANAMPLAADGPLRTYREFERAVYAEFG